MAEFDFQNFLWNTANNSIKESLKDNNRQIDQSDRIIVWLVGFSITAITLTIAGLKSENPFLAKVDFLIIIFSFLVIFFGISSRVLSVIFQKNQLDLIIELDQFTKGKNIPDDTKYTRFISEYTSTIPDLLEYLKNDFNIILEVNPVPPINSDTYKKTLLHLIEIYNKRQDEQLISEINFFNKALSNKIGKKIPEIKDFEHVEDVDGNTKGKEFSENRVWKYIRWFNYFFIATCVTFVMAIFTIMICYLFFKF
jgi:hypothetical protein